VLTKQRNSDVQIRSEDKNKKNFKLGGTCGKSRIDALLRQNSVY